MIYKGTGANHIKTGEKIFVKHFPDGEIYVKVPENPEKNVFYIQSFFPNQNEKLMESLLTIDALYDNGTKNVKLLSLYFPYTKQDKIFKKGEALSVKTVLKLFSSVGVSEIHFINAHFLKREGLFREWGMDLYNHNAAFLMKEFLEKEEKIDVFILPGTGASDLIHGDNVVNVTTRRDEKYVEKDDSIYRNPNVFMDDLEIEGKNVAIVDDMISTGGTMYKTCKELKTRGAKKVVASAVHGLFVGEAKEKLKSVCDEIVVTNTIKSEFSKVDIEPLIKKIIEENERF